MTDNEKQIKFLELFEPCRESLVKFSKAMTRDVEMTKDLVQETTLRAYDKFHTVKSPVAFKSFLFSTASRIYKRQIWRSRLFSGFRNEDDYYDVFDSLISKEPRTDAGYDIEMLHKALQKISQKQREAVILFEIVGLSIQEICDIQGGTKSAVKSRVQRARRELGYLLGVNENENSESIENEYYENRENYNNHLNASYNLNVRTQKINTAFEVING